MTVFICPAFAPELSATHTLAGRQHHLLIVRIALCGLQQDFVARRAVLSGRLVFAGLRDPVTPAETSYTLPGVNDHLSFKF